MSSASCLITVLSQLYLVFVWCPLPDLNRPPTDYKSVALPDELKGQVVFIYRLCYLRRVGAIATNSELLSNWVSPMHLPVGVLPVLYEDNLKYGLGRH